MTNFGKASGYLIPNDPRGDVANKWTHSIVAPHRREGFRKIQKEFMMKTAVNGEGPLRRGFSIHHVHETIFFTDMWPRICRFLSKGPLNPWLRNKGPPGIFAWKIFWQKSIRYIISGPTFETRFPPTDDGAVSPRTTTLQRVWSTSDQGGVTVHVPW